VKVFFQLPPNSEIYIVYCWLHKKTENATGNLKVAGNFSSLLAVAISINIIIFSEFCILQDQHEASKISVNAGRK
jgi:hypothetical protein